jgi:hypothetical protein
VVGANTLTDLVGNKPSEEGLGLYYKLVREEHRLELFHQLIFSAIRRLKRREMALAVIDAQSGFESAVASMLKDGLRAKGWTDAKIDGTLRFRGHLHFLQPRLQELDKIAEAYMSPISEPFKPFSGSDTETEWRENLYNLRNEIVHGGRRTTTFEETKSAIVSGLKAVNYLHGMCPYFARSFMWTDQALELKHLDESAGRLFRLFES